MTSAARTGRLTEELITVVTGLSENTDRRRFLSLKDSAVRTLRHHGYGRTDHFDVQSQLEGLDEKLRVLDEDALADALASRLATLWEGRGKWTPDVLAFLLQLSDQPATNSSLGDLEQLKPPASPPPLTWEEILADDPLDEGGVWDDIDFAADTSDDEDTAGIHVDLPAKEVSAVPTVGEEKPADHIDVHVVPIDSQELEELRRGRFWSASSPTPEDPVSHHGPQPGLVPLTELQCIREVLFMLSGLPTSLFRQGTETIVNEQYAMKHAEQATFHQVLGSFVSVGDALNDLRQWTSKPQANPLLQKFRAAVEERLRSFEKGLAEYQGELNGAYSGAVISLIHAERRVKSSSSTLVRLSELMHDPSFSSVSNDEGFKCLEMLYDSVCSAQTVGDDVLYDFMARLFFECFQTYLRPLEEWMLNGELQAQDVNLFICEKVDNRNDLGSLWHDRYVLRKTSSGDTHAPSFLHVASVKIFNAGKSVVFLKSLDDRYSTESRSSISNTRVDYQTVVTENLHADLAPFPEEFERAFDNWITSRQQSTALALRSLLFSNCGLWRCLDALEHIYFLKDGATFSPVATNIFDKIDHGKDAWNDRFLLTELIQGAYSGVDCVDEDGIAVRSTSGRYSNMQTRRRSVKVLANVTIEYTLPWPVINIIRPSTFTSYQRIFTFLLQIRRAQHILGRLRLLKDSAISPDDMEAELFYSVRHRLLWHANLMYNYLTSVVIMPCTAKMRDRLAAAQDLEEMVSIHGTYVAQLEDQLLLSKKLAPIYQAIISILDQAILLSDAHSAYVGEMNFDVTDRSLSFHGNQDVRSARRGTRRRDLSSSDEDDDSDNELGEADTSYISFQETTYRERLRPMREQFDRLRSFVQVGLRGVARAGGESCWDVLADSLVTGTVEKSSDSTFGAHASG